MYAENHKSDERYVPKYHKWAAHVALSKEENRNYYYQHFGCLNFCKSNLGSAPTVSILTIILTSIFFFVSAERYLYFTDTSGGHEFWVFTTENPWYLRIGMTSLICLSF